MGKRISFKSSNHQLPEEIIEEILTYLPVKSLSRFKCVSKQWRFLISSKSFIKEHLKKSSSDFIGRHQLIYTSYYSRTRDYRGFDHTHQSLRSCPIKSFLNKRNKRCSKIATLNHHPGNTYSFVPTTFHNDPFDLSIRILGSCNGLILITFNLRDLFLWNLSTRKFRAIPSPCFPKSELNRFVYGLGYDDSTDDFKVVSISFSPKPYQTKIYSLRTDSWKKIESYDKGSPLTFCGPGKFVNGKMYWESMYMNVNMRDRWNIVSLSLVEEKYEIVARPEQFLDYDYDARSLQVLGGHLSFTGINSELDVNVWVMNKYGDEAESWSKIWTFSDFADPRRRINGPRPTPIWLNKNGDIGVAFGLSTVVVYNGKNKLRKSRVDTKMGGYCIYVESLVSPFGDEEFRRRKP